jgi:hypothetical protein
MSILRTLDVGEYDAYEDSIIIEGTKYSGCLFRDALGIKTAIGHIYRIENHEDQRVTVRRMFELENSERLLMNEILSDHAQKLALNLECMILSPSQSYEAACEALEQYRLAIEGLHPTPPTFMGEPI